MKVFLIILGELTTIIASIAISINSGFNAVLQISKNGYKIKKEVLDEYEQKVAEKKKNENKLKQILGTIFIFIPIINIIKAITSSIKLKNSIMEDPLIKEAIVPMTDDEKAQYERMTSKFERLTFTAFTSGKENDEEEFMGFIGGRPIVVDHGLTSLYYEPLEDLGYTLDEVKRLNEATTYSYRIGMMEEKYVAVIGIPNPESLVSRIQLKEEDYKVTHDYKKITEDEAEGKTFIVYPFTTHDDTSADFEKVLSEIKASRN